MKKLLLAGALALGLLGSYGISVLRAGITCTLPFTLQNNTIADATQVMANYNALVTCFTSAAASGVNSDITSLTALSTPITPAQGGSYTYVGGTSTGSANAQVVASLTPSNFTLAAGKRVTFIAGFSNTGATTLNASAQGATNIFRRTQLGASALVGGEIVAGQLIEVVYDGTQFQLIGPIVVVGQGADWFTPTAPVGWFLLDGTSLLRASYPDLFTIIGTTYGATDGTHFSLPDERGRMTVMSDSASRITGVCAGATTVGNVCGSTSGTVTIGAANVPQLTVSGTADAHTHLTVAAGGTPVALSGANQVLTSNVGAGDNSYTLLGSATAATTGLSNTASANGITATANTGSANTALTVLNGSLVVNKIIKY